MLIFIIPYFSPRFNPLMRKMEGLRMDCVKVDAVSSQRSPYKPAQSAALPAAFHLLNSRPPARMSLARQGTHGDSRGRPFAKKH